MESKTKRKTPRITPSSVYLGEVDLRKQREARLDDLAAKLGLSNRSELIQEIADGHFGLTDLRRHTADTRP